MGDDPIFLVAEVARYPVSVFAETINEHWKGRYRLHSFAIDIDSDTIIAVFEWMPPG